MMDNMKYTEALRKLFEVMEGRPGICQVKFDRENDSFDVIGNDSVHTCFGDEFRNKGNVDMKKVECISVRDIPSLNKIRVGKIYYLDLSSLDGDFEGDWYGKIYEDIRKNEYVGRFKLSHFKTY